MSDIYSRLEVLGNGVMYERAVERALVRLLGLFCGEGQLLEGANVYGAVRGVPLVWDGIDVDAEDEDVMGRARDKGSYIVVVASEYGEKEGDECCKVRVVVTRKVYDDGASAESYERWVAGVRGIMSVAAQRVGVLEMANGGDEFEFSGWARDGGVVSEQYVKRQWVYEEVYDVSGVLRVC